MPTGYAGRWWAALALVLAAVAGSAQEVQFVEPGGGTVRGNVPVQVSLDSGYQKGFVVFYLGTAGKALQFQLATLADRDGLFGFTWETQNKAKEVADGEYRILAVGYAATGEAVGQASLTVEVQNQVSQEALPARGILLRHNLTPGRESHFIAQSSVKVKPGEGAEGNDVKMFGGGLSAEWLARVLWRNNDGRAQIRNSVYRCTEAGARGRTHEADSSQKFLSLIMEPEGRLIRRSQFSAVEFPYAQVSLEFPDDPVKVGESWRAPMTILLDPRSGRTDNVMGKHTLTGVEWQAGYRCAVIDSEFEGGPYQVALKGDDKDDGEWMAGVTAVVKGKRRTYFAYQPEVGKVLRIEEDQEQFCTLQLNAAKQAVDVTGAMGNEGAVPGASNSGGETSMMETSMMEGVSGAEGTGGGSIFLPPGFEKGGANLMPIGEPAKDLEQGTPEENITIVHFSRDMRTDVFQDFLGSRR